MSAPIADTWRVGVTSKPFDAWTVTPEGDVEPLGSHATQADAEMAVRAAGRGAVSMGRTFLRWHAATAPEQRAELVAIFARAA